MSPHRGSTLILALVILTGVITTAVSFTVVSLSNYKQAINIDDAIVSYYLAEVGVERGAYYFRRHETDPGGCGLSNCQLEIEAEDKGFVGYLAKDDSVQFDIYSPGSAGYTIRYIVPTWAKVGTFDPYLELSLVGWAASEYSDPYKKILFLSESGTRIDIYNNCARNGLPLACDLYRLRFKALDADIKDLEIRAQNVAFQPQNIPGVFEIKAKGTFGRSQQAVAILTSHLPPLSGLYDYLIFSEEELVKAYCGDDSVQGSEQCDDGSQCSAGGVDCTLSGDIACYYPDPENPGEFITVGDGKCLPRNGDGCSSGCEVE